MEEDQPKIYDFDAYQAPEVKAPVAEPPRAAPANVVYDFDSFAPQRKAVQGSPALTVEDVIKDEDRLGKIRTMMSTSKDAYYQTAPAEEVLEDFMSHMRYVSTNEISTGKELYNLTVADDRTKAIYGEAYKVYDEMGNMFSNGDAWNGMLDYAGAVITSPSTYLGLGIGKAAGTVGTKVAAKKFMQEAITTAAKQAAKGTAKQGAEKLFKTELAATAAKSFTRYQVGATLLTDVSTSALQDYWYQGTRMEAGVQDEYDFMQGAISTAAGSLSAALPLAVMQRSASSPLSQTGDLMESAARERAKTATARVVPLVKASLEKAQTDWAKLVKEGLPYEDNTALKKSVFDWFTNLKREDSLPRILHSQGVDISFDADEKIAEGLIGYAQNMGDDALEQFNEVFRPLGVTFGEAASIFASTASEAGKTSNPLSQISKLFKDLKNVSVGKQNAGEALLDNLNNPAADVPVTEKQYVGYAQSVWKKTLVSTFSTTAVNIKGWGLARASSSLADLTSAAGLMGRAGIRAVIDPAGAGRDVAKARHLLVNQTFALQTLVDPFLSAQAFTELLDKAPTKVRRSVTGQVFGGVDDFGPQTFGLNPNKGVVKGVEAYANAAQKISFVHLQDTLTKGVTGLTALDKESRLAFGKGIQDLIVDGETWKLTTDMWENASKAILRETFSEDLSKGTHMLKGLAGAIQNMSNTPGLGFFMPFGKFLNNTVAFTYRHSPIGVVGPLLRAFRTKSTEELGDAFARATVGGMALAYAMQAEKQKEEEGLQWFEVRDADGSVQDISTLFPYSLYALLGRISYRYSQGEGMDISLMDALKQQLGPVDALESLTNPSVFVDLARSISDPQMTDEERSQIFGVFSNMFEYVGGTVGGIVAGYTRPFEVIDRSLSEMSPQFGGGMAIDRKQTEDVSSFVLGATRYTSSIFNYLLGEETEYGNRLMGVPKESATSDGPVMVPPVAGYFIGTRYSPPSNRINKVLAMVDKPPFKVDSFSSGIPEYDAFLNQQVTPPLEREAMQLLESEAFMKAPKTAQMKAVNLMIERARKDVLNLLEGHRVGDGEDRLNQARSNFLMKDRAARLRAKKALGITTEDHKLSLFEIEALSNYLDIDRDDIENF